LPSGAPWSTCTPPRGAPAGYSGRAGWPGTHAKPPGQALSATCPRLWSRTWCPCLSGNLPQTSHTLLRLLLLRVGRGSRACAPPPLPHRCRAPSLCPPRAPSHTLPAPVSSWFSLFLFSLRAIHLNDNRMTGTLPSTLSVLQGLTCVWLGCMPASSCCCHGDSWWRLGRALWALALHTHPMSSRCIIGFPSGSAVHCPSPHTFTPRNAQVFESEQQCRHRGRQRAGPSVQPSVSRVPSILTPQSPLSSLRARGDGQVPPSRCPTSPVCHLCPVSPAHAAGRQGAACRLQPFGWRYPTYLHCPAVPYVSLPNCGNRLSSALLDRPTQAGKHNAGVSRRQRWCTPVEVCTMVGLQVRGRTPS
jgi:hypothetical protein